MKLLVAAAVVVAAIAAYLIHPPQSTPALEIKSPRHVTHGVHVSPPPSKAIVYVAGEVNHPGVYAVAPGARVVDALASAGGAKADADLVAVNLAAPLHDGDEVAVPARGATPAHTTRRSGTHRGAMAHHGTRRKKATPPPALIDLNHADADALAGIPGIGPLLAERIVAFRDENGPFDSVDELADVAGITDRRIEQIAPYLTVSA